MKVMTVSLNDVGSRHVQVTSELIVSNLSWEAEPQIKEVEFTNDAALVTAWW
jgi:hypothetical protein